MTLEDAARRLGVAWLDLSILSKSDREDEVLVARYCKPRPRLDIAHECLGKLPMLTLGYSIEYTSDKVGPYWLARRWDHGEWEILASGTFEEAVTALCERHLNGTT